jgi:broad specificity phosphatase PhoE
MEAFENKSRRCTVYLLRHGDSRQDTIRRFIGRMNFPLNERGEKEADFWRQKLFSIPFGRVCSSGLARSIETARIIVRGRLLSIEALPELDEINLGQWEGLPVDEVRRRFPLEYEWRGADLAGYRIPGGESFSDVMARVLPVFEEITKGINENVLIIGHAGVNRVILCHLLGVSLNNLFRLGQDYCCLNIIEHSGDAVLLRGMNICPSVGE